MSGNEVNKNERKYYVSMRDAYMGGWGIIGRKTQMLVFKCEDHKAAETVSKNGRAQGGMKGVAIHIEKPYYTTVSYYTRHNTKANSPKWYVEEYFKNNRNKN